MMPMTMVYVIGMRLWAVNIRVHATITRLPQTLLTACFPQDVRHAQARLTVREPLCTMTPITMVYVMQMKLWAVKIRVHAITMRLLLIVVTAHFPPDVRRAAAILTARAPLWTMMPIMMVYAIRMKLWAVKTRMHATIMV